MNDFNIDSHKLMFHVTSVCRWLEGKTPPPIYLEVSLCGMCNHGCIFCAFDYLKYNPVYLRSDKARSLIVQGARLGVKSILYSGEGEPLLHKDVVGIIALTRKKGIDAALSTNGILFDKKSASGLLPNLTWIRFSVNAANSNTYSLLHRSEPGDFATVTDNIEAAVKIRDRNRYRCTIGMQFLFIKENFKEVYAAAKMARDLGADYLAVKPLCLHPQSRRKIKPHNFDMKQLMEIAENLKELQTDNYKVIFRMNSFARSAEKKEYLHCFGANFSAHITADGNIYPCNNFAGQRKFRLGNIYENGLGEIWNGVDKVRVIKRLSCYWDVGKCRRSCRLDKINSYLWRLKHPQEHDNFI